MIELIVLGRLPGTEVYLSFNSVVLICISLLFAYDLHRMLSRKNPNKKTAKN